MNHIEGTYFDNDGNAIDRESAVFESDSESVGYGKDFAESVGYCKNFVDGVYGKANGSVDYGVSTGFVDDRYIFNQIKVIATDNKHIIDALRALEKIETTGTDGTGGEKAEAIGKVVQAREATNQQMLRMLDKMYDRSHRAEKNTTANGDDREARKMDVKLQQFDKICESLRSFTDHKGDIKDEVMEIICELTQKMFA